MKNLLSIKSSIGWPSISTTKLLIIGTPFTIGVVLIARRCIYGYYWRQNESSIDPRLQTSNSQNRKSNGTIKETEEQFERSLLRSKSNSSSTSTITNANQSGLGSIYDITDNSFEQKPKSIISSGNRCSTCTRTRRLSWKTSSNVVKSLSVFQLINLGSDSLNNAIKTYEECKHKLISSGDHNHSIDKRLDQILEQLNKLSLELDFVRNECTPLHLNEEADDDDFDRSSVISSATTTTLGYYDVEPNLHFFKLYQKALEELDQIDSPRVDRTEQLGCDSNLEFKAKVHCIRIAFNSILEVKENRENFKEMGKEILEILLNHSIRDPTECLAAYKSFIDFVSDTTNHETVKKEIAIRSIPCLSFYDVVLDYIILDSFDDVENPPSAVSSVANNRWLSAGFRELALQTAVSAVMRRKRSKLTVSDGFFSHFYSILDHISPVLAWGFLGTDQDLKLKCFLVKESLQSVIRDYFSFDRCRYTSVNDLYDDILRVTKERYWELNNKLSILST